MPKEHYKKASESHKHAAKHLEEASDYAGKGDLDSAAKSAHKAHGHATSANEEFGHAAKKHAQGNK